MEFDTSAKLYAYIGMIYRTSRHADIRYVRTLSPLLLLSLSLSLSFSRSFCSLCEENVEKEYTDKGYTVEKGRGREGERGMTKRKMRR